MLWLTEQILFQRKMNIYKEISNKAHNPALRRRRQGNWPRATQLKFYLQKRKKKKERKTRGLQMTLQSKN